MRLTPTLTLALTCAQTSCGSLAAHPTPHAHPQVGRLAWPAAASLGQLVLRVLIQYGASDSLPRAIVSSTLAQVSQVK